MADFFTGVIDEVSIYSPALSASEVAWMYYQQSYGKCVPTTNAPVFSVRPWGDGDGNAGSPKQIDGVPVVEQLRTRRDVEGALVALADGRYAVTGPFLAAGGARSVEMHARRRLARATEDAERAWWQEVVGAVALEGRGHL